MANHEDDCTFNNIASAFELLNVSIEDALNKKKMLDTRLDWAISLKREVELKEKAAEEAKEEAAKSGLDILAKVEALKQAQQLVKETNDMHAREVHAQKAVLAKDLKELQLRMSGVLNEGRRSLGTSNVMHRVLKMRLNKAVKEKELADIEKLEKEKLPLEALAFEESQMLKLVKESERLKLEAVENSKLQDLFKERESTVNILHGEVSIKCQDINLFIEHLDQPVLQLRGLLLSSQTSADVNLERQEGNLNGSSDVKRAPVVEDITEVGYSVSNKSFVASAQTHAERVAAPLAVKHAAKNGKNIIKGHLDQPFLPLPFLPLHGLLMSSQTSADVNLKPQEGNLNGSSDLKRAPVVADVTEVGHSVSTKTSVASAQTHAERVAAPLDVKHAAKNGKNLKKGKTKRSLHKK